MTQQPDPWSSDAPAAPVYSAPPAAGASLHPMGMPFRPAPIAPPDRQWAPARVEPVAGTEFGLVQLKVPPLASGLAAGSLIAGIASIGVSGLVLCFGLVGAQDGWGGAVAGAFALLGTLIGGGAVALGLVATRQIRRSGRPGQMRFTGRGTAVAGVCCGAAGAGISLLALVLGLVLQSS
jgi:hypothetical protein